MNPLKTDSSEAFDKYADDYDRALAEGVSVSGEDKSYFARNRVAWTAKRLKERRVQPGRLLDFGCGIGGSTTYFFELLGIHLSLGVDTSNKSIEVAQSRHGNDRASFGTLGGFHPDGQFDLAFCNGVFHHIPVEQRLGAAQLIYESLRAGGWFAFWENNPWNPGTRIVMKRIPFDRDAITLTSRDASHLLGQAGFEVVLTDFLFIFPRFLRWFRPVEPWLCSLPLGSQYQVLCRKPR